MNQSGSQQESAKNASQHQDNNQLISLKIPVTLDCITV